MDAQSLPAMIAAAVDGLPPRPADGLDAYLDAAEVCIQRYGWSRMSPQDVARELGVNRTTVYRILGPKNEIFRLLVARLSHRLIERAVSVSAGFIGEGTPGPDVIIELTASTIEHLREDPTTAKVLADEPELVAGFMRDHVPEVIDRFTEVLGPFLGTAMHAGLVAKRDPHFMTEWMVRMCISLLFAPPRADVREFLAAGCRPLFATGGDA